ncbi:MAG: DUF3048 domain-containing protein [Actinomycetia bacterium]|nr:DUF3048 domain-containing protein [Actinomycetes bacterium]
MRNRTLRLAILVGFVASIVGCSSSNDSSATSALSATTESSRPTTTTVPPTTVAETAPPTTVAPVPVYPLTGLPITDEAAAARPALVVKIDNHSRARPQSGLNEADIVFEEIVEAQTRFAAVFQSQGSDPVGPIRSGRAQDIDLLGSLNHPLFVWSGGNRGVTKAIEASDFVDLSAQHNEVYGPGGFYRSKERGSPHNLYAQTSMLWTLAPAGAAPPPQQFTYLAAGVAAVGEAAAGVDLVMDGLDVGWRFDAATGRYLRTTEGEPHLDAATGQISSANVIVMVVEYFPKPSAAGSPQAITTGFWDVLVFTGGVLVRGTWSRPDRLSPIVLTDTNGQPIALTPGNTWVELPEVDTFTVAV